MRCLMAADAGGAAITSPDQNARVRVIIVDDHPVVRAGVRAMLESGPGFEVVGESHDGDSVVALCETTRADVVLMDLRLGDGVDGVEATRRVAGLADGPRVLILTTYHTDHDILRAIEAGAAGYLLKDAAPEVLLDAVRRAARGDTVLAAPIANRLMERVRRPEPTLSRRELEILDLLAAGLTNRDIGGRLHISEATVKSHVAHIYTKLGVDNRASVTTVAISRGLIRPR